MGAEIRSPPELTVLFRPLTSRKDESVSFLPFQSASFVLLNVAGLGTRSITGVFLQLFTVILAHLELDIGYRFPVGIIRHLSGFLFLSTDLCQRQVTELIFTDCFDQFVKGHRAGFNKYGTGIFVHYSVVADSWNGKEYCGKRGEIEGNSDVLELSAPVESR